MMGAKSAEKRSDELQCIIKIRGVIFNRRDLASIEKRGDVLPRNAMYKIKR